jgi:hypothetical protein
VAHPRKRKNASSNDKTKQCKNHTVHRMAFKGTFTLFAFKEYWYEKFKGIKVLLWTSR